MVETLEAAEVKPVVVKERHKALFQASGKSFARLARNEYRHLAAYDLVRYLVSENIGDDFPENFSFEPVFTPIAPGSHIVAVHRHLRRHGLRPLSPRLVLDFWLEQWSRFPTKAIFCMPYRRAENESSFFGQIVLDTRQASYLDKGFFPEGYPPDTFVPCVASKEK